jgi:hypothetical protein
MGALTTRIHRAALGIGTVLPYFEGMVNQWNILMALALIGASGVAADVRAAPTEDNPQAMYHEDKADITVHDAPAPGSSTGFMPYQGDSLEDTYADDPVKLYSTPGLGLAYKPESTPHTEWRLDLHGAAVNDDPDARDDNPLHTPGDVEAGASFHF